MYVLQKFWFANYREETAKPRLAKIYKVGSTARKRGSYNHRNNIVGFFKVLSKFPFTTSEVKRDY